MEIRSGGGGGGVDPILNVVCLVASGIGRGWSWRAGIGQPEGRVLVGKSGN